MRANFSSAGKSRTSTKYPERAGGGHSAENPHAIHGSPSRHPPRFKITCGFYCAPAGKLSVLVPERSPDVTIRDEIATRILSSCSSERRSTLHQVRVATTTAGAVRNEARRDCSSSPEVLRQALIDLPETRIQSTYQEGRIHNFSSRRLCRCRLSHQTVYVLSIVSPSIAGSGRDALFDSNRRFVP